MLLLMVPFVDSACIWASFFRAALRSRITCQSADLYSLFSENETRLYLICKGVQSLDTFPILPAERAELINKVWKKPRTNASLHDDLPDPYFLMK